MSFEQLLENIDVHKKSMDFMEQAKLVKLLTEKYVREKDLSRKDANILAWKNVRSGAHIFEDLEDEEPNTGIIHQEKGLQSEEKTKMLKIYDLVKKISNKNKSANYTKLEKYFTNLNKKIH
jgi:hypothetical protein